jgi:hypothetical protein
LDWLPLQEKQFILDNKAVYLYGTELPDNNQAADGIGDTTKHHVYFSSSGTLQDDIAAVRAREEYAKAVSAFNAGNRAEAAKRLGVMAHYIAEMAVFGHVMGASTAWGTEQHHSDYENYVQTYTNSYQDNFNSFLVFDGTLSATLPYDAAKTLAYDTTFDVNGDLTCVWMDQHYNWNDVTFRNRAGESLNLAVNAVADVLHAYEDYQLYRVYQRLYQFCTVDVSSFYLDVIKDRLYCEGADSVARRSAQTVLYEILDAVGA